jgi:hypothetical protein
VPFAKKYPIFLVKIVLLCKTHSCLSIFDKKINFQKYLLQIVLCQFITLWGPMFLSSLSLSISNPGFTFGYEPNTKMPCVASTCLILMDLAVFYLHPIILKFRISILKKQQERIKGSRDLRQGLLYRWTEHWILPMTTGGGLLTLIMQHKLTQSL